MRKYSKTSKRRIVDILVPSWLLNKYNFNGLTVKIIMDKDGDYICYIMEEPSISAFGSTKGIAMRELSIAWALAKEYYDEMINN